MQQLSRPYQIAIGALLLFALAWFAFLKPSDDAEALAPAAAAIATPSSAPAVPGAAGLGRAVDKANAVAAAAKSSTVAGAEAAASAPAAQSAPTLPATGATGPAEPASAAPAADPSAPIVRHLAGGKVVVLLFFTPKAAEDRAVRRALTRVDRHRGKVVVRSASIARVADYSAITGGVDILQSPTVLVIGRDRKARALVGYTDTRSINQLVGDVGGPAFAPRRR